MLTPENVRVFEFQTLTCTSDGVPVKGTGRDICVLFNLTHIDEKEARELVEAGMYNYDPRLVVMSKQDLYYLRDKEEEEVDNDN